MILVKIIILFYFFIKTIFTFNKDKKNIKNFLSIINKKINIVFNKKILNDF